MVSLELENGIKQTRLNGKSVYFNGKLIILVVISDEC